jgi:hypothetical protein
LIKSVRSRTWQVGKRVHIQLITRSKVRNLLVACAFFAIVLTLFSSAKSADLPTFVDLPSGLIIGAHAGGKWLSSEEAGKALEPGRKYRLFGLTGKTGDAVGGQAAPNTEVCPDVWEQTMRPATEKSAIALAVPWNPMPRTAVASDKTQEVYVKAARDFLVGKGIGKPVVKITQLLRIDLDGDGEDEALLSATNYPGEPGESPYHANAGNYSFVLLRHVVDGKVETKLIDGEFYPKASESQTPYRYEVSGLLDLDGDGRLEIIIYSAYYEGATVTVWRLDAAKPNKVLEIGCGA